MSLTLLKPPALEPLTLADARLWLRLDGTTEDAVVTALLSAARMAVEAASGRLLINQTWMWRMDRWPTDTVLPVPLSPLQSIVSVVVAGASGAVPVPPAAFVADAASDPPRLALIGPVPTPSPPVAGIAIELMAGYGPDPAAVPEPLRHAVRITLAALFENRGDLPGAPSSPSEAMPPAALALVAPFRRRRL